MTSTAISNAGSASSTKTGGMGLDSMGGNSLPTSQSPRPGGGNSVFPNNTPQTPPKDYSQSNKVQIILVNLDETIWAANV